MVEEPDSSPDLVLLLTTFPDQEPLIRRIFLEDEHFRSACADYRLAREGLAKFERMNATSPRPECAEYRTLISELEAELRSIMAQRT